MKMGAGDFTVPESYRGALGDQRPIEKARHLLEQRRLRNDILGTELFGDPGWELMLDLYVAHASGKQISMTSAAIGSGRPMSTGLRWVRLLVLHGFLEREADPDDGRRHYLRLTDSAVAALEHFLTHD